MSHVMPYSHLIACLAMAFAMGCGGAPESQWMPEETPPPEAPALADDGAKPGEHGCGSCVVRACAAGGTIDGLRIELALVTALKDVRYDKAVVRVTTADGRGEALQIDPGALAVGSKTVQSLSSGALRSVKTASDLKGASGALMLYWTAPEGPRGQQLPMAVEVGGCP